jgi:hypothetical protein
VIQRGSLKDCEVTCPRAARRRAKESPAERPSSRSAMPAIALRSSRFLRRRQAAAKCAATTGLLHVPQAYGARFARRHSQYAGDCLSSELVHAPTCMPARFGRRGGRHKLQAREGQASSNTATASQQADRDRTKAEATTLGPLNLTAW